MFTQVPIVKRNSNIDRKGKNPLTFITSKITMVSHFFVIFPINPA